MARPRSKLLGPCVTCLTRPSNTSRGECDCCNDQRIKSSLSEPEIERRRKMRCAYTRKHALANAEKCRAKLRLWRVKNKAKIAGYMQAWRRNNPEKRRAAAARYYPKRQASLQYRLTSRISARLRSALGRQKAGRSWRTFLDFTYEQLRDHLESRFTDGMTWEKFFDGEIEIDHIRPIASFRYTSTSDADFKECWALSNLQPLWSPDNAMKNSFHDGKRWLRGAMDCCTNTAAGVNCA